MALFCSIFTKYMIFKLDSYCTLFFYSYAFVPGFCGNFRNFFLFRINSFANKNNKIMI